MAAAILEDAAAAVGRLDFGAVLATFTSISTEPAVKTVLYEERAIAKEWLEHKHQGL